MNLIKKSTNIILFISLLLGKVAYAGDKFTDLDDVGLNGERNRIEMGVVVYPTALPVGLDVEPVRYPVVHREETNEEPINAQRNKRFPWCKVCTIAAVCTVTSSVVGIVAWQIAKHHYYSPDDNHPLTDSPVSSFPPHSTALSFAPQPSDPTTFPIHTTELSAAPKPSYLTTLITSTWAPITAFITTRMSPSTATSYFATTRLATTPPADVSTSTHEASTTAQWLLSTRGLETTTLPSTKPTDAQTTTDATTTKALTPTSSPTTGVVSTTAPTTTIFPVTPVPANFVRNCTLYNQYLLGDPVVYAVLKNVPCGGRVNLNLQSSYSDNGQVTDLTRGNFNLLIPALQQLDVNWLMINSIPMPNSTVAQFAPVMATWSHLGTSYFEGCTFDTNGAAILAPFLPPSITSFDLAGSHVGKRGVLGLLASWKDYSKLKTLSLYGNDIDDTEVTDLTPYLRNMTALTSVYLGGNNVTARGCLALRSELGARVTVFC